LYLYAPSIGIASQPIGFIVAEDSPVNLRSQSAELAADMDFE
jgi:hypothetical protein